MNTIIVYKSEYGSSRKYALWLAEELHCKAESVEQIKPHDLLAYDVIVYVAGLYAGRINGFKKISRSLDALHSKKLILCMVGMTTPAKHDAEDQYDRVFMQSVPEEYRNRVKHFSLKGDLLFSKMSFLHRTMMKMPKRMVEKIPAEERTEEQKWLLESFGKDSSFTSKENILELVEYICAIQV